MSKNFSKEVTSALNAVGYVCDEKLGSKVALLLTNGIKGINAMILDGDAGTGKTYLAQCVAKILGADFVYTQCHPGTTADDLLFDSRIVKILQGISNPHVIQGPEDVVKLGFLPKVFRMSQEKPVVALLDELDKAHPKTDSLMLSALQEAEVIVDEVGTIKANKANLFLFITKNAERSVSEPLIRRCRREYMQYPSQELEFALLTGRVQSGSADSLKVPHYASIDCPDAVAKVIVSMAAQMRSKREDLLKPPSTQELQALAQDIARLASWGINGLYGEIGYDWLAAYEEDREILKQVVTKEKLNDLIATAVKASGTSITLGEVKKCDDSFVAFGR